MPELRQGAAQLTADRTTLPESASVIRLGQRIDARSLWTVERSIVGAGEGVVQEVEDLPPTLVEYERLLDARLRDVFQHLVVAVIDEQAVGYAEWSRFRPAKLRHCVSVALGVAPQWQSRGLGRRLMERLIHDARHGSPKVQRMELGVLADNLKARTLYESLGFRVEGVRRGFVRDQRGERDDCLMALLL